MPYDNYEFGSPGPTRRATTEQPSWSLPALLGLLAIVLGLFILAGTINPGSPMQGAPADYHEYRPGLPEDHADTRPEMIYTDMTTTGESLP